MSCSDSDGDGDDSDDAESWWWERLRASVRRKLVLPLTWASAIVCVVAILVADRIQLHRPALEALVSLACIWGVLVLVQLALTARDEIRRWHVSRTLTRSSMALVRQRGAARVALAIDTYGALVLSFSLASLALWLFDESADKSRFYTGFDGTSGIDERSIWRTWSLFLASATLALNGSGQSVPVSPRHWLTLLGYALYSLMMLVHVVTSVSSSVRWLFFDRDKDDTLVHVLTLSQALDLRRQYGSIAVDVEMAAQAEVLSQQQQQQQPPPQQYYTSHDVYSSSSSNHSSTRNSNSDNGGGSGGVVGGFSFQPMPVGHYNRQHHHPYH